MIDVKNNGLENIQLEIKDTLESLGCVEVISVSTRGGDVRFLLRAINEKKWLKIILEFLNRENTSWYSHLGTRFFSKKKPNTSEHELVFAYFLAFYSDDLEKMTKDIRQLFLTINKELEDNVKKDRDNTYVSYKVELPWHDKGFEEKLNKQVRSLGSR